MQFLADNLTGLLYLPSKAVNQLLNIALIPFLFALGVFFFPREGRTVPRKIVEGVFVLGIATILGFILSVLGLMFLYRNGRY